LEKVCVKVPNMVAKYFMKHYGDLSKLSEELLNDALKSIIQQEAKENKDARKIAENL